MRGPCRSARHLTIAIVLATLLVTISLARTGPLALALDNCSVAPDVRATTCRLVDGVIGEGKLEESGSSATYRVDVLGPGATLTVTLSSENAALAATLLDWRGNALGQAKSGPGSSPEPTPITVSIPGVYGLRVDGDVPSSGSTYKVSASISYSQAAGQPVWPPALASGDGPLGGERQVIRVPRGGTPAGGVAASRILGAPPAGIFADFTMVADVQFEKIVGPSALTVRFRYEPEAGGGTGYILSIDPFGGNATLDAFEEGQRRSIVSHIPIAVVPSADGMNRLILTAHGPAIRVALDGQTIIEAADDRFARGLIAVGAVTWSDPVAVTFDHIQVTTPSR